MFFVRALIAAALVSLPLSAVAQNAAPSPSAAGSAVSANLRPVLSQITQAINGLNIRRWKAPDAVRNSSQEDVSSIQRDLSGTLSGLLDRMDGAPTSIPAAFAVYRNVNALYDTLLRVVLTANLAASEQEAGALQSALSGLETARNNLGDSIQNAAIAQQADFVRLRSAVAAAAAAQRNPARTTVVDDGPEKTATTTHHHTAAKKPAAKPPANSNSPANGSNQHPQ